MDKLTFHFLIIALIICYFFIRGRKLITKNPIGLIASSLYFFRFFVPSYWISSGLFNFNGIPTFNYDLYSMYLSALIITILTLEISINFKLFQFQLQFKRRQFHKGYKHIFYIIICIILNQKI